MLFKKSNRFYNTILYKSIIQEIVLSDLFNNSELNITIPKYVILKDTDKKCYNTYILNYWNLEKLQEYNHKNIYQSSIYGNIHNFLSNYDLKWDGFKTLKDAKDYITELESEEVIN